MAGLQHTSRPARSGYWFKSRRPRCGSSVVLLPVTSQIAAQHLRSTLANRSHLLPFLPWANSLGRAQSKAFVAEAREDARLRLAYHYAIVWRGRLTGIVSVHSLDAARKSGAIGIWLTRPAQHRGIAFEAASLLISMAFRRLGLRQLIFLTAPSNRRGKQLSQRLGFRSAGSRPNAEFHPSTGRHNDLLEHCLERSRWAYLKALYR